MKKIFLALFLIAALSLPTFAATEFVIDTSFTSADIIGYEPSTTYTDASGDIVSTEPYYYLKNLTEYDFPTIEKALLFANSPADYAASFGVELSGDFESFTEINMTIQASDTTSIIGDNGITMSRYPSVSELTIAPSTGTKNFYMPSSATTARHFIFNTNATVNFSNFIFEGNNDKGGIEIDSGTVGFDTVVFRDISSGSDTNGGAVYIKDGNATFSNCNFSNNSATTTTTINGNGGAIAMTGGTAYFDGSTSFSDNTASTNGGAIYITGGSANFASGITFLRNSAQSNGGAIIINSPTASISLDGVTFDSNDVTDGEGGAIIVGLQGGNLSITDCSFTNNSAYTSGGAISLRGGNSLTFGGMNTFSGNRAGTDGGAIAYGTVMTIDFPGLLFTSNIAGTNGGAIAMSNGIINLTDCVFNANIAEKGAGIAVLGGSMNVAGSSAFNMHSDSSIIDGGAIYVATRTGTVDIQSDVTFSSNLAENGSLIYASNGTVNIYTDIINSSSNGNGGAVCVSSDASDLTVNIYGNISANHAENNGGAVYIASGTVNVISTSGDILIDANTADNGGAFYLAPSSRAQLNIRGNSSITFSENTATGGGGAIYAGAGSRITFLTELLFESNKVFDGDGGAIWLGASNQLASMTGVVTFRENEAQRTDTSNNTLGNTLGNGGAIYIDATGSSTVTLNASHRYTFTNNQAQAYGGAIYTRAANITIDSRTVATANTAEIGGGFASSATGIITLQNGTSISNQSAPDGGAIYASEVVVDNSTMSLNGATSGSGGAIYAFNSVSVSNSNFTENKSEGTDTSECGGGAIYVVGDLTVRDTYFYNNTANRNGAAIFANNLQNSSSTTTIENSYFDYNRILQRGNGNGGALCLYNNQKSTITGNTFTRNESLHDGGAIHAQGKSLEISSCYFEDNFSERFGGAIYFNQKSTTDTASLEISNSMFQENSGNGSGTGGGGAVYVFTNVVNINSCTFLRNFFSAARENGDYGGALYIYSDTCAIENSTFVENELEDGADGISGGGAVALSCEDASILSCTFTSNKASYGGGAIYVISGALDIGGTIAVGNTETGTFDIDVEGSITSRRGYNRIGVFGKSHLVTDFTSEAGQNTDKTGFPDNTFMTLRSTYFSDNQMAVNERADLGSNIPPYIGSTLHPDGQFRLLTLMLNEDATLPIGYRATNAIPYERAARFPAYDERGVPRRNPNIGIDIGAVFFDGTRPSDSPEENASYSVAYIQISGVPNAIRRVGQTASLIAKIYYTNGRTAYGGTGAGNEPVTWSATPANYLKVNSSTGVITAMRITPQETYVTLKCQTNRTDIDGNPASAIARIKIAPALEFGELNNSPESGNSNIVQIIHDLRYEFDEYNMGYGLIDKNDEIVQSYNYMDILERIFDLDDAYAIATTASNYSVEADENNALTYVINVENVKEGAVSPPMTYLCSFTAEELKSALGSSIISSVARLAAEDETVDAETVKKIFSVIKVNFEGENDFKVPVLGPDSSVNINEAIDKGALEVTTNGQGIDVKLNLMVANVEADGSEKLEIAESNNENYKDKGAIFVPDGSGDDKIYGTIIFPQKGITASQAEEFEINKQTFENFEQNNTATPLKTSDTSETSSGSSTGCNITGLGLAAMALLILKFRRR